MDIGTKIKMERETSGITQEELGKRCGTTKQTIYKYENGIITNIPIDKLEKIANALNISSSSLLGWEQIEQPTVSDGLSACKQAMYDFIDTLSDDQIERLLQIARVAFDQ